MNPRSGKNLPIDLDAETYETASQHVEIEGAISILQYVKDGLRGDHAAAAFCITMAIAALRDDQALMRIGGSGRGAPN